MLLRFEPAPPPGGVPSDGVVVVTDMAWTAPPGGPSRLVALRDVVAAVLGEHDLYAEAMAALDAWAGAAGLDDAMTIDGTSFWPSRRLGMWWAVHDWLLWAHVLGRLLRPHGCTAIDLAATVDAALADVARAVGSRDGIAVTTPPGAAIDRDPGAPPDAGAPPGLDVAPPDSAAVVAAPSSFPPARLAAWYRERRLRRARLARRQAIEAIFASARGAVPPTVLVFSQHVKVEVRTGRRPRLIDPYLEPVAEGLERAGLHPLRVVRDLSVEDEAAWRGVRGTVPWELVGRRHRRADERDAAIATAAAVAGRVLADPTPLRLAGADLGPVARARLAREANAILPGRVEARWKIRRLIEETRAAAVVLAYEYGRPEWIAAARDAGVPVAAVQHGAITPWHPGYRFPTRPAGMPLADRTLVYGRWERDLLVERSVYRAEEVVVAGAPRLDLVPDPSPADRAAARRELGVGPDERLVVHSTSWGEQIQRFYTPAALAAILDRPLPGVHLVLKLHPSEPAEQGEEYRRLIAALARSRGFAPPRVTVVGRVDLYRLLRAADAHLGLFSTVLTDAVAAGTPNLVITAFATRDILGYVTAGVGLPVRDGGDLLAALATIAAGGGPTPEARARFIADHFEPGPATPRIVDVIAPWARAAAARPVAPP